MMRGPPFRTNNLATTVLSSRGISYYYVTLFALNVNLVRCNYMAADRYALTCGHEHVPLVRKLFRSLHADKPTAVVRCAAAGVAEVCWPSWMPSRSPPRGRHEGVDLDRCEHSGVPSADKDDQNVVRSPQTDTAAILCWRDAFVRATSSSIWTQMIYRSQDTNNCNTYQTFYNQAKFVTILSPEIIDHKSSCEWRWMIMSFAKCIWLATNR